MKKYIPFVIAFALFMETLDATIISTAIPKIALSLHTDPINLKLALTSYLLSLAIFIPISGWLSDRYGTKNIFILALIVFTIGSISCGLAINLMTLILSRILQGIGGALMMPVGRLILLKSFEKHELVKVTNYVTIPSLLGPALGPVAGGIIASFTSWRWIFFVNIPFGLAAVIFSLKVLTNHKSHDIKKLDVVGFILIGLSLAGFSFGFESYGDHTLSNKYLTEIILLSITLAISYLLHARTIESPFIDRSVFKIRTFKITVFGSFFSRCGIGGIPFLLPLFFQLSLGETPLYSGLLLVPYALAMLTMKFCVKPLLRIFGFKNALIMNTILLGLSIVTFATMNEHSDLAYLILLLSLHGLFSSTQFSCMNVLSYIDLSENNQSAGTSIGSAIQQLSMSFGIALSALLLRMLLGTTTDSFHIHPSIFHKTFLILGTYTMISSIIFLFLGHQDGVSASQQNATKASISHSATRTNHA